MLSRLFESRRSAGQLAAINRSQAVIEFDLDGRVLQANENFLAVTGYGLDEVKGQHHRLFVSPEERESPAYKAFWSELARGEFVTGQFMRVAKGGREIWIQASYNPILGAGGKPVGVVKYAFRHHAATQPPRRSRGPARRDRQGAGGDRIRSLGQHPLGE